MTAKIGSDKPNNLSIEKGLEVIQRLNDCSLPCHSIDASCSLCLDFLTAADSSCGIIEMKGRLDYNEAQNSRMREISDVVRERKHANGNKELDRLVGI